VKVANIRSVVAVTEGDCSNSQALLEILQFEGIEAVPFAYPYDRDRELLALQIHRLRERFGARPDAVRDWKALLDRLRAKAQRVDELTWREGVVSGLENHYWLVNCSDMNRDPARFEADLDAFLAELETRDRLLPAGALRLAYIGVPPIFTDLYPYLESLGVQVVFNEVQRQFAMPHPSADLVEQYLLYTYPYDIFWRLADIEQELARRRVDGVIHYTQNFCYHQVEDMIVRRRLSLPVLTLEGDKPVPLDARSRLRVESFVEMLAHGRATGGR
jgi:benzoyl-CoA reductase/2-hydroxyglutaryl-CoA dehydratase subunit BcrC/BadD/HgdB